jgi:dethiobiotin synthetase
MTARALFITGTDTNVGKTVVTAGLTASLLAMGRSVCVFKPIQTGSVDLAHPEDPEQVRKWVGDHAALALKNRFNFHPPVAPYVADTERVIKLDPIRQDLAEYRSQYDWVLVEGAGGVRVPITPPGTGISETRDLITALDIPALVVSRPNLGTINHTLMSVESLQAKGVRVLGVVVTNHPDETREEIRDEAIASLPEVLAEFLPVPVLAWIPPLALGNITPDHLGAPFDCLVRALEASPLLAEPVRS